MGRVTTETKESKPNDDCDRELPGSGSVSPRPTPLGGPRKIPLRVFVNSREWEGVRAAAEAAGVGYPEFVRRRLFSNDVPPADRRTEPE